MARKRLKRVRKTLGMIIAVAAVVGAATSLVWSFVVPTVTQTANRLDDVDLAIGSAAVSRAATSQAVVFAVSVASGTATGEALDAAIAEAAANLDVYDQLVATLRAGGVGVDGELLATMGTRGRAVLDLINAGDVDAARAMVQNDFETGYRAALDELSSTRATLASHLDAVNRWSDSIGYGVRLAVTLVIPIMAIFLFWWAARQRVLMYRRRADERLAAEVQRGREKDALLAAVSERFRAPLTSIHGLSDVLVQKKHIKGLDRELVALISAESADMHRAVEDILVASQLQAGTLTASADIISLADAIDDAVKPMWASGIDIKVECPEVWVVTDREKVRHILRNLLSNAASHGAAPIFVEGSEAEGVVQCAVIDHGAGLPPGHWADSSDPHEGGFKTASGIGLEVAYSLAGLIGARLEHFRVDDQTRFIMSFAEDEDGAAGTERRRRSIIKRIPRPMRRQPPQEAGLV